MITLLRSIAPELLVATFVVVGMAAAAAAQPSAPEDVAAPPADAERTPSGLASKVVQAGTGSQYPSATSQVTVHYSGWLTSGSMFDSSVTRGMPATFPLDGVIRGWTEGCLLYTSPSPRDGLLSRMPSSA
mgnify:CR=1 FL=1